jgi:hypothetical protein
MSNPSVQAAVIAAAVSLAVAILTQVVAHSLTQRRETQKFYNEVYQKLLAPVISDVFLYIDLVTNFRRGLGSSPEKELAVKDQAIEAIKPNLMYGSPKLITAYHQIHSAKISDHRGHNPTNAEEYFHYVVAQEFEQVRSRPGCAGRVRRRSHLR